MLLMISRTELKKSEDPLDVEDYTFPDGHVIEIGAVRFIPSQSEIDRHGIGWNLLIDEKVNSRLVTNPAHKERVHAVAFGFHGQHDF